MTTFCIAFYESYLSTELTKQADKSLFQVNPAAGSFTAEHRANSLFSFYCTIRYTPYPAEMRREKTGTIAVKYLTICPRVFPPFQFQPL
jgi:hypothetical protein